MPATILDTKTYLQTFAGFRNAHYKAGEGWQDIEGKDFIPVVNAAIKKVGKSTDYYAADEKGYDELRSKHNSTKMAYRTKLLDPIHDEYRVTEWTKIPKKQAKIPVVEHLDAEQQLAYMRAVAAAKALINLKMPGLPPFTGTGRSSYDGGAMTDWLD